MFLTVMLGKPLHLLPCGTIIEILGSSTPFSRSADVALSCNRTALEGEFLGLLKAKGSHPKVIFINQPAKPGLAPV